MNYTNIENTINQYGFFYYPINNTKLVDTMLDTVKEYFSQPEHIKNNQRHNSDGLGYIGKNRTRKSSNIVVTKESFTYIPNKIKTIDENVFSEYYNYVKNIAEDIFHQIMDSNNINKNKYIDIITPPNATLSILHYPQVEMTNKMVGIHPHCDWGLITVLYTDNNGLQININNRWINVPTKKDHFIINIADMVEILTNGKYKSTLHRVINQEEKYSMALFFEPRKDSIIKPIGESNAYSPVRYSDYHGKKISCSYNGF